MRKSGKPRKRRGISLKTLGQNLIIKERINTTLARAKKIRPKVERLISIAKKHNLASLRWLLSKLSKEAAFKLYHEIAPRYQNRAGGYLRILKVAQTRKRDAAKQAIIEFV